MRIGGKGKGGTTTNSFEGIVRGSIQNVTGYRFQLQAFILDKGIASEALVWSVFQRAVAFLNGREQWIRCAPRCWKRFRFWQSKCCDACAAVRKYFVAASAVSQKKR